MDIKEIALKIAGEINQKHYASISNHEAVWFTEALIAEIAKQNEPVAWARYPKFTGSTQRQEVVFKKPDDLHNWVCLYTFPPTAEQIANETAEAIAEYCRNQDHYCLATEIENGAWKDFKK